MAKRFLVCTSILIVWCCCVPSYGQEAPLPSQGDRIRAFAEVFAESGQFQGTVRVDIAGATAAEYTFGQADISAVVSHTAETQFYIASITKAFTATLALQLVDAVRLDLDAPVGRFFPGLKDEIAADVTLRHLLAHTSGIVRDYTEALTGDGPFSEADLIRSLNSSELLFEPGTRHDYSNTGYHMVAQIIQHVTGQNYAQLLEQNIVLPAKLLNTTVGPGKNVAEGYESEDLLTLHAIELDAAQQPALLGAGGVFSTTGDLIRFVQAITDGRLLSAQMLALMLTAADVENGNGTDGMGWTMYPAGPDVRLIAATGVSEGYMSFLAWKEDEPETRMAMLLNDTSLGRRGNNALFMGMLNLMLGEDVPIEAPETPLYSFLNILLEDGQEAAIAYCEGLDWSHPPVANAAASQATGRPNGGVGETMYAWAPSSADAGAEWLKLVWNQPVVAKAVRAQFTQIPRALTGLDLGRGLRPLMEFRVVTSESDDRAPIVMVSLDEAIELRSLTLHMNTADVAGWPQIDAVGLVDEGGEVHWADSASASSSAFAASGVGMHDLPTREVLAKLSRRLGEAGRQEESAAVSAVMAKILH